MKSITRILAPGFVGMILFIVAATILQIPYHFSWYTLHRYFMIPSRSIMGVLQLLIWDFLFSLYPIKHIEIAYVAIAAALGFFLGLIVRFLWANHRIGKLLIRILIPLHLFVGVFISFWIGDLVRPPTEICQAFLTDTVTLKIVGYGSHFRTTFDNFFVLSSVNDGRSWSQALVQSYDDFDDYPPRPDCEEQNLHYRTLPNNDFVWIWTRENLSISNDGGDSWYTWSSSCGRRKRCDYGPIVDVTFENPLKGHMEVIPHRNGVTAELYSYDGGLTWSNSP